MMLLASTLPSNDGYVAAAYVFFFALILVYLAIMAARLARVERRLRELQERRRDGDVEGLEHVAVGGSDPAREHDLEREAV